MSSLLWSPDDASVIISLPVSWSDGTLLLPAGTPLSSAGAAANTSDARYVLLEDVDTGWYFDGNARRCSTLSRPARVLSKGYLDLADAEARSGISYSSACKAALAAAGVIPVSTSALTDFTDPHSIPSGGTAGQVLAKSSSSDYDAAWQDASSSSDALTVEIYWDEDEECFLQETGYTLDEIRGAALSGTPVMLRVYDESGCLHLPELCALGSTGFCFWLKTYDSGDECLVLEGYKFSRFNGIVSLARIELS